MKNIAIKMKIWKYVDSKKNIKIVKFNFFTIVALFREENFWAVNQNDAFVSIKKLVRTFDEFSSNQKKSYKINIIAFQMKKKNEWSNRAWSLHSWCNNQNIDAYVYFFRKN